MQYNFPFEMIHEIDSNSVFTKKQVFIVIEKTDLVNLVKF